MQIYDTNYGLFETWTIFVQQANYLVLIGQNSILSEAVISYLLKEFFGKPLETNIIVAILKSICMLTVATGSLNSINIHSHGTI